MKEAAFEEAGTMGLWKKRIRLLDAAMNTALMNWAFPQRGICGAAGAPIEIEIDPVSILPGPRKPDGYSLNPIIEPFRT